MTDHKHDHDPASDPPGAVSDQNQEQGQSGLREDGTHPEPRTSGKQPHDHQRESTGAAGEGRESTGAAGEGSQSTGHPGNAG